MTTTTAARYIALMVMSVDQFKVYPILFATEALALAWDAAHPWEYDGVRSNTYLTGEAAPENLSEAEAALVRPLDPETDPVLYDLMYPTCEHGMNAHNCYGPMHFMDADQERMYLVA